MDNHSRCSYWFSFMQSNQLLRPIIYTSVYLLPKQKMNNKNQLSRSTVLTPRYKGTPSKSRDRLNVLRNDSPQHLPLKFPKGYIIKHSNKSMLTESTYNPQKYGKRVYQKANRSRFFQECSSQLTHSERISKEPKFFIDTSRKLASPGEFSYLSRESGSQTVRLRTFEDYGAFKNQKKMSAKEYTKQSPILNDGWTKKDIPKEKMWDQRRKSRDHGDGCREVLTWNATPKFGDLNNDRLKTQSQYRGSFLQSRQFK